MKEVCPALSSEINYDLLGAGFASDCFRFDGIVVKRIKVPPTENVFRKATALKEEYTRLRQYIQPYLTETKFIISGETPENCNIYAFQEYLSGINLEEATQKILLREYDGRHLLDFYQKCLDMYQKTRFIPDIYGRPGILSWYTKIQQSPNVICRVENDELIPHLIDVGFARLSKSLMYGDIHNELLANSIRLEIRKLLSR